MIEKPFLRLSVGKRRFLRETNELVENTQKYFLLYDTFRLKYSTQ